MSQRDIFSVSRLNSEVKTILETCLPTIWVEGEISNLARPASGHIYFSLKDKRAQVRCAMFKNSRLRLRFVPENGSKVLLRARVSLYEGRVEFQLIAEHMEDAGEGALRRAFEDLKEKLRLEGLFAEENKLQLPDFPKKIGVITSPSGAAIRDILSVINRRYPLASVLIFPVLVQGDAAAGQIVQAITSAQSFADIDTLIISRGGGSLEDLWPFNEEVVARAMYGCSIPIISGIGHETDFSIADFVADVRAPTPSVAAEIATPDKEQLFDVLEKMSLRITYALDDLIKLHKSNLQFLHKRLSQRRPDIIIKSNYQRLDYLEKTLIKTIRGQLAQWQNKQKALAAKLAYCSPKTKVDTLSRKNIDYQKRMVNVIQQKVSKESDRLKSLARALHAVSPLNTLDRGYSVTKERVSGMVVSSIGQVENDSLLDIRLRDGILKCRVEEKMEIDETGVCSEVS